MVRKCDLIFAQGSTLAERFRKINNNVHIFPFGVKIENFLAAKEVLNNIPVDIINIKRPIIGYIGGIHRHIDFKLLRFRSYKSKKTLIIRIKYSTITLIKFKIVK